MIIHSYPTKSEVDSKLVRDIIQLIKLNYRDEKSIILAVSGGSTPFDMYRQLAPRLKELLDENVVGEIVVVQVDERYVPSHSDRTNQKLQRQIFSTPIEYFPMLPSDIATPLENAATMTHHEYEQIFQSRGKIAPDIVILGMGTDGHTASLFPGNPRYIQARDAHERGIIGMYVEAQKEERISMTSTLINSSDHKILFAHGDEKLIRLIEAHRDGDLDRFPVLSVIEDTSLYTTESSLTEELKEVSGQTE